MEESNSTKPEDNYAKSPNNIAQKLNSIARTLISVALFVAAFYFFFDWEIKFILILVVVLFIHELGHYMAMKAYKYNDVQMFFIPLLGAMVTGTKTEISQWQRSIVLLAGPIPGIIIGGILIILELWNISNYNLETIGMLFIVINVFNLLPIKPLDGGNLVETLFFGKKDTFQITFLVLSISIMIGISYYLDSYILLIIPVFLLLRLYHLFTERKVKSVLEKENINYKQPIEKMSENEFSFIRKTVIKNYGQFNDELINTRGSKSIETEINTIIKSISGEFIKQDMSKLSKFFTCLIWLLFTLIPIAYCLYIFEII